jgi:hypothetical protein
VGKVGRPTPPDLALARRTFPDRSPSTVSRWTQAMRILRMTGDQAATTAAIKAATRPNGTFNVSVLVRLANVALVRFVAAERAAQAGAAPVDLLSTLEGGKTRRAGPMTTGRRSDRPKQIWGIDSRIDPSETKTAESEMPLRDSASPSPGSAAAGLPSERMPPRDSFGRLMRDAGGPSRGPQFNERPPSGKGFVIGGQKIPRKDSQ